MSYTWGTTQGRGTWWILPAAWDVIILYNCWGNYNKRCLNQMLKYRMTSNMDVKLKYRTLFLAGNEIR